MTKRILAVAVAVTLAGVSQSWAAACLGRIAGDTEDRPLFCAWNGGACWAIVSTNNDGDEIGCETQVGNCGSGTNVLYIGGTQGGTDGCGSATGNTQIAVTDLVSQGDIPTVSCDFGPEKPDGTGGCFPKTEEDCIGEGGTIVPECGAANPHGYCRWKNDPDNCYPINPNSTDPNTKKTAEECEEDHGEVVSNCNAASNGVYCDYGPVSGDEGGCYWKLNFTAAECTEDGGEPVSSCPGSSVRYMAQTSASGAGLRASYNRGTVNINWKSSSQIKSGKITLINVRGRTVASSRIKNANSSNIVASMGAGKVPAGMYFVRVVARDVSGKKVVLQSAVSIVK